MKLGNTELIDYGIQNEKSDLRAHVSISARSIYLFPTQSGLEAINTGKFEKRPAYTGNIKTAEGFLVPPDNIEGCTRIRIPLDIFLKASFNDRDNTSTKGNKAVFVVKEMLKQGLIPITLDVSEVTEQDLQIQGLDIIVKATKRIQVKCDWKAGHREFGGTGNLFLQVRECNPNGYH